MLFAAFALILFAKVVKVLHHALSGQYATFMDDPMFFSSKYRAYECHMFYDFRSRKHLPNKDRGTICKCPKQNSRLALVILVIFQDIFEDSIF